MASNWSGKRLSSCIRGYFPCVSRANDLDNWDEIRTAFHLAKEGTVTAAAKKLGVHRATIIRHIDALEQKLGSKVFIRHGMGYTPNDLGKELVNAAGLADDQFKKLSSKFSQSRNDLEGELLITAMGAFSHFLMPSIALLKELHPKLSVKFVATSEVLKLEYGEAHISLRPGVDCIPGNTVIPCNEYAFGLYAHESYVREYGLLNSFDDIPRHNFIRRQGEAKTRFESWMNRNVPVSNIAFESTSPEALEEALNVGLGIGFAPVDKVKDRYADLVEMIARESTWSIPLRLIVHQDSFHLDKVQEFLRVAEKNNLIDRRRI